MTQKKSATLKRIEKIIIPILRRNNVVKAGIFGSYARGEQRKRSDIDILIKYGGKKRKSLLDLIGLKQELEQNLSRNVDLAEYAVVHPQLKERIKKEEVRIL